MPRLAPVIMTDRIDRAPTECNLVLLPEWRTPYPNEMACPHRRMNGLATFSAKLIQKPALGQGAREAINVRSGSKADMCSASAHVRFAPKSGHVQRTSRCLLWANSGHGALGRQCRVCRSPDCHQAVAIVDYVYIDHAHALAAAPHTTHEGKRGLDSWLEVVDAKIYGRQRASEHHRQGVVAHCVDRSRDGAAVPLFAVWVALELRPHDHPHADLLLGGISFDHL